MEQNKIQKPLIIEMEEAKAEMAQAINGVIHNHNLPIYIINMIFSEFSVQLKEGAKNELESVMAQMENSATAVDDKDDNDKG